MQRSLATELGKVINEAQRCQVSNAGDPLAIVRSVHVSERGLPVSIARSHAASVVLQLSADGRTIDRNGGVISVLLPIRFAMRGSKQQIVPATSRPPKPHPVLISALRKAHAMLRTERGLLLIETAPGTACDQNILRLAFLAPVIQRVILGGR